MNFDRVATIYDATRAMPEWTLEQIADHIVAATDAGPETRFLELGIGTGRIALPIARRGYDYAGVDISEKMMAVLRDKAEAESTHVQLITAGITDIPLPAGSVDVVIAVHVLHLVQAWREAIDEARRVLKPGGHFILGGEQGVGDASAHIRQQWTRLVEESGPYVQQQYGTWNHVEELLTELGCYCSVYRAVQWQEQVTPLQVVEEHAERTYSRTWSVPDDVLLSVHERLQRWVEETYKDPSAPLTAEVDFMLLVTRFPEAAP